jgi:glycosyltransferase involved in cell wall biosynthesis
MIHQLKITVCIITYKRVRGLQCLLAALEKQEIFADHPFRLNVVVVDNDLDRSAYEAVERFRASSQTSTLYVHEPHPGIPIARNTALRNVPETDDYVCFLDDDEWPSPQWAAAFAKAANSMAAGCFYGPVAPSYPTPRPDWFVRSGFFAPWSFENGEKLGFAASNNVMISIKFIEQHDLRFEERMQFTGGSDYLFFRQGIECGLVIRWVESALVYEEIPLSRMTWSWILKRHYRIGNTFSVSERIIGNKFDFPKRLAIGLFRMSVGLCMLPIILFSAHYGMRAVAHITRGAGMIIGLLGHKHEEYAPSALAVDRTASKKP